MISLTKLEKPSVLVKNSSIWTDAITKKIAAGEELTETDKGRYRHKQIKETLLLETSGKCAYCESKLEHIAYGDIEHITPKNSAPDLWFEWNNLTLACDVCNTNKGEGNVIDPYAQDPETRVIFLGPSVFPKPGDDEVFISIKTLKLNREKLVGRRTEHMEYLWALLDNIANCRSAIKRAILVEDFDREIESNREYAALSRFVRREAQHRDIL